MEKPSENYQSLTFLILAFLAIVGIALWYARTPAGEPLVIESAELMVTAVPTEIPWLRVHVVGAVVRPGVYSVQKGARIEDALNAAGGLTPDGDSNQVNLAAFVSDGQQIRVPTVKESSSTLSGSNGSSQGNQSGKVNINTASQAELEKLPSIGEVTAQKIVTYRETHGPFSRIEQLRELKILRSDSDFEQIRELISVE